MFKQISSLISANRTLRLTKNQALLRRGIYTKETHLDKATYNRQRAEEE